MCNNQNVKENAARLMKGHHNWLNCAKWLDEKLSSFGDDKEVRNKYMRRHRILIAMIIRAIMAAARG